MSKTLEIIELLPDGGVSDAITLPHWGMNGEEIAAARAKGYEPVDARFIPGLRGVELSLLASRMQLAHIDKSRLDALELEWRLHKDADPGEKPKEAAQIKDSDDIDAILSSVPKTEAFLKARAEKKAEAPSRRVVPERLIEQGVAPDEPVVASFGPHHGKGRPIGVKAAEDEPPRKTRAKELDLEMEKAIQEEMLKKDA